MNLVDRQCYDGRHDCRGIMRGATDGWYSMIWCWYDWLRRYIWWSSGLMLVSMAGRVVAKCEWSSVSWWRRRGCRDCTNRYDTVMMRVVINIVEVLDIYWWLYYGRDTAMMTGMAATDDEVCMYILWWMIRVVLGYGITDCQNCRWGTIWWHGWCVVSDDTE